MPDKGILAVGFFNPPVGLGGGGCGQRKIGTLFSMRICSTR